MTGKRLAHKMGRVPGGSPFEASMDHCTRLSGVQWSIDAVGKAGAETYGKIRPGVFDVAASKRAWTSAQLTTFQNAFT